MPSEHKFLYHYTFIGVDLEELEALDQTFFFFGYNRPRILSINDEDFLHGKPDLKKEVKKHLLGAGRHSRIHLFTSPRYFGYAFNPVNFYLAIDKDRLTAALVEVNNTFGDRHSYPLPQPKPGKQPHTWIAYAAKSFHVSPFNDMEGYYCFVFHIPPGKSIRLEINLYRDDQRVLSTYLSGKQIPLTQSALLRYAIFRPWDTAVNNMPRILWQAAQLHWRKKLTVYKRPIPSNPHTLKQRESNLDN